MLRSIKAVHKAAFRPIADLITYSPIPSGTVQQVDPFLFLNHHGHQVYPPHNNGLPFGPHPHRGMETVTFILEGDIMHKDSGGHESVIEAGGVQWMTAGSGLIHAEVSSEKFKREGGPLEILQLWLNLPARHKMTTPKYIGLQKHEIPSVMEDGGKVKVNLIAGEWSGKRGAFESITNVTMTTLYFETGGKLSVEVPTTENIFCYVIRGALTINAREVEMHKLVEFNNDGTTLTFLAKEQSIVLFGYAEPLNEPVVAQGPFVMNTEEEIAQAYQDFREGKFGTWS